MIELEPGLRRALRRWIEMTGSLSFQVDRLWVEVAKFEVGYYAAELGQTSLHLAEQRTSLGSIEVL
jgi:hypothetical protein